MKMTKLESADEIIKQNGECMGIDCMKCCLNDDGYSCLFCNNVEGKLALAIKYKKENENEEI